MAEMSLPSAADGHVDFATKLPKLAPTMSENLFVAQCGSLATAERSYPPYANYRVVPSVELDGFAAHVFIGFESGLLRNLRIYVDLDESDSVKHDWSEWSEEDELRRKAIHDQILAKTYGPAPYRFGWGEVVSLYDPRSGSSEIVVRYPAP